MKVGKYHIDPGLLIAATVLLSSIVLAAGAILTWGPADSRAALIDWGAKVAVGLAGLYGILRGKGLFTHEDDHDHGEP